MNITCAICKEIFAPSDDIYSTQCGHVFHLTCIEYWFKQTKKSCPTCREKATLNEQSAYTIHRVYFDITRSDNVPQNVGLLQEQIDNLTFKLKIKEKDSRTYQERFEKAEKENKGLVSEVRQLESKLEKNKEIIFHYKEQLKGMKLLEEENNKYKKQITALNNTLEHMQNVKDLLQGSPTKVDKMFENTMDPKKLQIYLSIMKKAFNDRATALKDLRDKNRLLRQEMTDIIKQRNHFQAQCDHYKRIQENWTMSVNAVSSENFTIPKKAEKSETLSSIQRKSPSEEREIRFALPKKASKHKIENSSNGTAENVMQKKPRTSLGTTESVTSDVELQPKKEINQKKENEENSPYLQSKGGVSAITHRLNAIKRHISSNAPTILFEKKPRLTLNPNKGTTAFDGFGGRSRDIEFSLSPPRLQPKKTTNHLTKVKKPKLNPDPTNRRLDMFIEASKQTNSGQ